MKIVGNKEKGYQTVSSFPGVKEDKKAKEELEREELEKETKKNKNKE